jgi:hypothetical protein
MPHALLVRATGLSAAQPQPAFAVPLYNAVKRVERICADRAVSLPDTAKPTTEDGGRRSATAARHRRDQSEALVIDAAVPAK